MYFLFIAFFPTCASARSAPLKVSYMQQHPHSTACTSHVFPAELGSDSRKALRIACYPCRQLPFPLVVVPKTSLFIDSLIACIGLFRGKAQAAPLLICGTNCYGLGVRQVHLPCRLYRKRFSALVRSPVETSIRASKKWLREGLRTWWRPFHVCAENHCF